ncbi:MAG: saccharopine dehydrogenase NADP-binding domain-containing protein [Rhodothermales bacterium]|nr:saccharopine dehydrogenase NADP-binding domain-containing protein [Rhodothermales bacterium]MBO6779184.1 saccharopine dehydrogenase NADP-binding domain-containing protein [Rhodothermales bacterium]
MRILVIGAGAVGSAIARDLAASDEITDVHICDTSARALADISRSISSDKLRSYQVSARDADAMAPILERCDAVVGAIPNDRIPELVRLALEHGCHYCDLGTSDHEVADLAHLQNLAESAGLWVVPGCGIAPGLVNVLCLHGVDRFDDPDAAFIRVGAIPQDPKPPFKFNFSWSAEKVLDDYTGPVELIENGEVTRCEPLTRLEDISFGEGFEDLEAFCTAGGLATLPERLKGKVRTLDLKTIRWPGHADRMRFVIGLGFAEAKSLDVRTHLTYRDVLVRRMRQRLGGHQRDVVLMRIVIHGKVNGVPRTLRYELIQYADPTQGISAMKHCTAIPAAAIARHIAAGNVPGGGVAPPEVVIPGQLLLDALKARGLEISEAWEDGFVSPTQGAR